MLGPEVPPALENIVSTVQTTMMSQYDTSNARHTDLMLNRGPHNFAWSTEEPIAVLRTSQGVADIYNLDGRIRERGSPISAPGTYIPTVRPAGLGPGLLAGHAGWRPAPRATLGFP